MRLGAIRPLVLLSSMSAFLYACDSSQSLTDDSVTDGSHMVEVRIDEVVKGTVDAFDLDEIYYQTVTIAGAETNAISIASIIQDVLGIESGNLEKELQKYTCNYESGTDGFRPTDKGDRCAPVNCSKALYSYIDLKTGNLVYGDELGTDRPSCYNVKNLAKILLTEVNEDAERFELYIDNVKYGSIDLSLMGDKIVDMDNRKLVKLSDVFKRLQPNREYDKYNCDLGDATGKRMSSDVDCPVRSCKDVMNGYIETTSHDIVDAEAAKVAACYEMKHARALYLTTPEAEDEFKIAVKLDDTEIAQIDVKTMSDKIFEENGSRYVWASDVIAAANPDLIVDNYKCNYLGQNEKDGVMSVYDPTTKSACKDIRSCSYAKTAKIDVTIQKMLMTDADRQNCHNVSNITTILIYSPDKQDGDDGNTTSDKSYVVNVEVEGSDVVKGINVYDLETQFIEKEGKMTIAASEIVAAANIEGYAPDKYTCDYAAADGFKASKKPDCNPPRSCTDAAEMALVIEEKKLTSDLAGCFNVKDFRTIIVKKIEG